MSELSERAVVVGTWAFSLEPVNVAARLVTEQQSCENCLEKALNVAEMDEKYGRCQVGRRGPANEMGDLEMDAAIMSGHSLHFGAVTALQGISRASSVARCVMEKSRHSMLTAKGAQEFAIKSGFHLDIPPVQTGSGDNIVQESKESQITTDSATSQHHDTLGMIVLDTQGHIAAGVTTSGMKNKARGRIGDSALPGCGLYADDEVGAVCCSGEGDEIMKFCPSFMVMELMRQGLLPEEACQSAIRRINRRIAPSPPFELAIIAVNMAGEVGAATTVKECRDALSGQIFPGFPFAVWSQKMGRKAEIRVVPPVT